MLCGETPRSIARSNAWDWFAPWLPWNPRIVTPSSAAASTAPVGFAELTPHDAGASLGGISQFPLIRQPGVELAERGGGEIHQELRQVELRVDRVPAAGAREA